jgi:hypothetical protein
MRNLVASAAVLAATAASAMDVEVTQLAFDLGALLASEEPCGLAYDQAAIAAFIDANVPPDAMSFSGDLTSATTVAAWQIEDQTESARTAHCASVTRTARHFGFIE